MKKPVLFITLLLLSMTLVAQDPAQWVDPFIGTDGKGNTYPGASLPFGMVQLSPDNGRSGWDWIAGYFYPDTVIAGFSHLHLSGTGAGDLYDISFFPFTGKPKVAHEGELGPGKTPYSLFSHDQEQAEPGYYQVTLLDYDVSVELTTTVRSGLQRYTFGQDADASVVLNLAYARNWDWVTDACVEVINDSTICGYRKSSGWAADQRVYFYAVFSRGFDTVEVTSAGQVSQSSGRGKEVLAKFGFAVDASDTLLVKTGISSVSIENAQANLAAEQNGFNFERVKQEAREAWNDQLKKIQIKASDENKIKFYTSLYHSMLGPTIYSDINQQYKGPDGNIHRSVGHDRYATFSLWDTYRTTHPLATLIHPGRTVDFIRSMLDHYRETGLLPVWELLGNETNMMMGYHAVPVIADAILKDLGGFDYHEAFGTMIKSAMQDKSGLDAYKKLGYVPYESRNWNVSLTLEYAFDDWCIAQAAKKLNKASEYDYFSKRAMNYSNHFDPTSGFMRARSENGSFRSPFDPNAYKPEDYCEANAWHYNWYVPHDIQGMIDLMGGPEKCTQQLDAMFSTMQATDESTVWISGYFGQYVHGNEPSHHVPYLYQYTGYPHKTEYWTRRIMDELYTTAPDGLCGNEDYGQMSAWYVFSALGFYPVNPASGHYVLGSPMVDEAIIHLPDGKTFHIKTINQGAQNVYVKSITLRGEKLTGVHLTHQDLVNGGELIFEMSQKPNHEN